MKHFKSISPIYLIIGLMITYISCNSFNSEKWIKAEDKFQREPMLKDLCKNYLMVGMDRKDIIKLLGKPDAELDSIKNIPKGVLWDNKIGMNRRDKNLTKKDSLLYLFYSETCSSLFITIESYIYGTNGSGPNYLFIVYDKNNKFIDFKLGRTEF